ncbi:MAG TPA: zinc ribbon domain-containing protein [Nitrososphaera sp.]|nr:zinc ribbon domain-containing protein [Nitrososphaera sp.]
MNELIPCPTCGKPLSPDSIVCPKCQTRLKRDKTGKHFIGRQPSPPNKPKSETVSQRAIPSQPKSNHPRIGIIVVGVILGVVFVAMYKNCGSLQRESSSQTPSGTSAPSDVSFDVSSVTLNYQTRQMEIRGMLRNNGSSKPNRVWVWAYFFAPASEYADGSWSDSPIEIDNPFASGDTATITATGHFHWWDNSYTPKSGYYARVSVSAQSSEAAKVPSAQRNRSSAGAYSVRIVQ